ncbi:MAG: tRNA guanosine(34) transglycosylase Tgt [Anaerolineaceae bacterium]|nr:tRNA guanosine(34) transglycosylase Tgt [Anaerolineaceae bacterium]
MDNNTFTYNILAKEGRSRAGVFHTPHGDLLTPVFAPVGTQATVKAVTPVQLKECGASLVLSNTYHLYLRPGADLVAEFGGLHEFMQWPGPMLTDSGGFQVFSLSDTRKVDEDGVTFKSHIDGSMHRFTPESSIQIQEKLGADIIMAFDECADPNNAAYINDSMRRTHAWAERCLKAKSRPDQALFGIVQGGVSPELRSQSAKFISSLGFPGHAIGGLSVGESKQEMNDMLDVVNALLPENKPRYLMGVGSPEDLVNGILRGVDIFDCVLPTRLARHSAAFTPSGRINLMNATFAHDHSPIDETCDCYACRNFTRGYIRHLIVAKEMLAATLISIHNIRFLISLVQKSRQLILQNQFSDFATDFLGKYQPRTKQVKP